MKTQTTDSGGTIYILDENQKVSLSVPANPRFAEPSRQECGQYHGWDRIIGGDQGDLLFDGYEVTPKGETILYNPAIIRCPDDLTDDEVHDLAIEILMYSFDSIGVETVEHS